MFGFLRTPRTDQPLPETVQVGSRAVALDVIRNPRARRLTLRIGRDGASARVTAPPSARNLEITDFIARHMGWLGEKLAGYPDRPVLREGVRVPLRGVPHLIVRVSGRGLTTTETGEAGPQIVVHGTADAVGRRVSEHLKKDARRTIEPMALELAAVLGRRVKAIRFKDTSSRWGSCTSDGSLSFSWRIMMAPPKVVTYLVAHEVAHLAEMNHGPKFWALCAELCAAKNVEMEPARAWLKRNGSKLQSIGFA